MNAGKNAAFLEEDDSEYVHGTTLLNMHCSFKLLTACSVHLKDAPLLPKISRNRIQTPFFCDKQRTNLGMLLFLSANFLVSVTDFKGEKVWMKLYDPDPFGPTGDL